MRPGPEWPPNPLLPGVALQRRASHVVELQEAEYTAALHIADTRHAELIDPTNPAGALAVETIITATHPTASVRASFGSVIHPARFSDAILDRIEVLLDEHRISGLVLDPFAGTGRVHRLSTTNRQTIGIEIEPEWAATDSRTIVGNALCLPLLDDSVDAIVTSPCYGNRFADHHRARDSSFRRSYAHDLRRLTGDPERQLHADNAGLLHFGPAYRSFHHGAWNECARVLKRGGMLILNVSDFVRRGELVGVVSWHVEELVGLGFRVVDSVDVETPRLRYGANSRARVGSETVTVLAAPEQ